MVKLLEIFLFSQFLKQDSRQQLEEWLLGNKVGDDLLRAGVPSDWKVADKTGAGGFGSRAIVAVLWPPQRKPLIVAIYMAETDASLAKRNAAIASMGEFISSYVIK